ncbi:MAG: hypothetical protein AB8F94_12805 [Saprospiraceae bacterium]
MKNLVRVSSFVFAILLFTNLFTSCKKDKVIDPAPEVTTTTPTTSNVTPSTNAAKVMALQTEGMMTSDSTGFCDCFSIFDNVDWETSDDEIIVQLEVILEELSEQELIELFTPVCTFDGEAYANACVAECNGVSAFQICGGFYSNNNNNNEDDWNECFSFVYPFTVVLPDGTNTEVNSDEELISAIDDWYDANPNSDDDPTLIYPVNVLLATDGSTLTINNEDELEDIFDACAEQIDNDCFTINFPISIQFPDGEIVEINSIAEGDDLVEAWEDANPTSTEDVEVIYPFDVTLENGTIVTINSEDEFDTFIDEECDGDWDGGCLVQDSPSVLVQGLKKMTN